MQFCIKIKLFMYPPRGVAECFDSAMIVTILLKNCCEVYMGSFHCPLGVFEYQAAGCIDCGMCMATTFPEHRAASEILKEYLRETAVPGGRVKKVCFCGKGGVGKSTVSAIAARLFADLGFRVLIIDTDESNPSLCRKLGFPADAPKPLISILERYSMEYGIPDDSWLALDSISFNDIPDEFLITRGNISLMNIGKIDDPFQGCACTMADYSRQLMRNLSVSEKEIVILDVEAGVESFGRGIEQGMDTVVAIAEPSADSI